mgnify:CR=1 FL=1
MGRGIVFTTDILIGISLVLLLLFIIPSKIKSDFSEISFQSLSYQAQDIITLLSKVKAKDVQEKPTIKRLIHENILKPQDLEKTLLDLIGSFWYAGNKSIARNITQEVLEGLIENCFSLATENETIYSSCDTQPKDVVVASTIASGYEIGKPVFGYIARAWVTKITKNTTTIIPFYPEGSGWTDEPLEITKSFSLPLNITIYNATLYVSAHFGTSKSQVQFNELNVNGIEKKDDITWVYLQEESYGFEVTTAAYGIVDITKELKPGNNTVHLIIDTPNYHSHIHPGMRIVVTYSLSQNIFSANKSFRKRYYFDKVIGRTGAWSMVSFFIPEEAENLSVILHLKTKRVDDTRSFWWDANDIRIYVNSDEPFYQDGVTSSCYFYTGGGYYCVRLSLIHI